MIGHGAPSQAKVLNNIELTPRDDNKKIVSEILKRVDQLIKKGNLQLALNEIQHAKQIDPRNVYTLALEERVETLLTHDHKAAVDQSAEAVPQQEHPAEIMEPGQIVQSSPDNIQSEIPADHEIQPVTLDEYKKLVREAWSRGPITDDRAEQLTKVREISQISDTDGAKIEKEIKYGCYKMILARIKTNPSAVANNHDAILKLRAVYDISDEEHQQLETQLNASLRSRKQREKLLIIDDDVRLLELLASSLQDGGFDVTALSTSDEAFALLRKLTPDLILCDINLETSTMGGFTFYERVQELKHLQQVPFIFLTGLTDEALVRTGKELGVDDYLMKPISEQTLLATLRGKLKRFRQLRKLSEPALPVMATA